MLSLRGGGSDVALASGSLFLACGTYLHAIVAAVEADAVNPGAVLHSCVVNVVIDRDVYVAYRLVVGKMAVVPATTFVAVAEIAIAVADAAVEADFRSPVAFVEDVVIAVATPVAGSPEIADFRSADPRSGNPIIIFVSISPLARRPDIAVPGDEGLLINGQFRWSNPNRYHYADLRGGCRGDGQQYECEQKRTNGKDKTHHSSFCLMFFDCERSIRSTKLSLYELHSDGAIGGRNWTLHDSKVELILRLWRSIEISNLQCCTQLNMDFYFPRTPQRRMLLYKRCVLRNAGFSGKC